MEQRRNNINVCRRCLSALQSREGEFFVKRLNPDEDAGARCEWCGETADELFGVFLRKENNDA